jgi:hypothetical protein
MRPVRVEQFLVVEAVVNRFQNSVYRQSIFFGDVFGVSGSRPMVSR